MIFALSFFYARTQSPPADADVIDDEANALINDQIGEK